MASDAFWQCKTYLYIYPYDKTALTEDSRMPVNPCVRRFGSFTRKKASNALTGDFLWRGVTRS